MRLITSSRVPASNRLSSDASLIERSQLSQLPNIYAPFSLALAL